MADADKTKIYSSYQVRDKQGNTIPFQGASGAVVTPLDTKLLSPGNLYVGETGNVRVKLVDSDTALLFKNVLAGQFMPIWVEKVYATGTTASHIIILR